ncbi:mannose-1-phosphate guanylyltransferase/mannose-6-phosphate isomerase [Simiduia agarivorans]|uniref:mannose-1-phosphate guanylyltransferase n=1 Tax=Simiduia agarivorans (strain DSM 21679 / JCM 13881 / BCRC 17597 / SA1) TaxID=1117647 RepID=K4KIG7_SIMAS|nr:mannose-1-phosphate guanylyltransferase/mannose-6-phosphate isomerase [Simiduia agarivorans]AFU97753.1 mannose-1-phosphate guanylyltransferase/mannose-6-phosphate isomerase [Simiduia agarivorans SA1 = DSM 21679]
MILPVILAGGTGTRLWPLSRDLMPKQYLNLDRKQTMLQATVSRLEKINSLPPLVICNEEHRFIAAEQLRQIGSLDHNILLEPAGKNTAPAIALAAFSALAKGNDPLMLVLAADHVITDTVAFKNAIEKAVELASENKLVTFGIVPTNPETGYGYIRRGEPVRTGFHVAEFVEKPDRVTALKYLESGEFYWNSGMFMFRASLFLSELKKHRADIFHACELAMADVDPDMDFVRVNKEAFMTCPAESVDYAVMEKTNAAVVLPQDIGWNDVGAWSSLWEISKKDANYNVHHGDVQDVECTGNFVYAENSLVVTLGLHDSVVVQTKDAVLVAAKDQVQNVKSVVQKLKSLGRDEYRVHREVYRPWGKYDSIDRGRRYQVKRITVNPGEKLSIQMHHHRSEHWIVVSGTAKVTIDNLEKLLSENQSIYIPLGSVHALENPGKIPLELIEVQSGAYLGEDDIVRFSDRYGRTQS